MTSTVARDVTGEAGSQPVGDRAQRVAELMRLGVPVLINEAKRLVPNGQGNGPVNWIALNALAHRWAINLAKGWFSSWNPQSKLTDEDERKLRDLALSLAELEAKGVTLQLTTG